MHQQQRRETLTWLRNRPTPEDRRAGTAAARQVAWENWLRRVDPDGKLSETDRIIKVVKARQKYFRELGRKGGSRPKRKAATT